MVKNASQYREKVSLMISWGHWFTFFNIILSLLIGSRYLFLMDWPGTLTGRVYAFISWLGQVSFISFSAYLLVLFPLTFIILSQRLFRLIAVTYMTAILTLLLLDTEIFSRFHMHLNKVVWEVLTNPTQAELARDWQILFILAPVIFLIQMLLSTWCWQKLRSLKRYACAKPIIGVLIVAFICTHLMYAWADANFYRPITMQKTNLPLSHPLTARSFLTKHGLIDQKQYQQRLLEQGNPAAISVEYPRRNLSFYDAGSRQNLLLIVVDKLPPDSVIQYMPNLNRFAIQHLRFEQHFSAGNTPERGLFGLFYGISSSYQEGIAAGRQRSALLTALSQQGYQMGLFATDGFASIFNRQVLFADFSLPTLPPQSNAETTNQFQAWFSNRTPQTPWFSYISYQLDEKSDLGASQPSDYRERIGNLDTEIDKILNRLASQKQLENTVIIITAKQGGQLARSTTSKIQDYDRAELHVPLIVSWPNTPAQVLKKMTNHQDIMLTLMQRVLHVKSAGQSYSQGEDLFIAERQRDWFLLGSSQELVVVTPQQTIILDQQQGNYRIYDTNDQKQKNAPLPLALLLQVFTESKRFISD